MKKILTLCLGIAMFTSCSSDDDSSSSSSSIVDSWEYSKEGAIVSGQEVLADYENDCASKKDYIQFNENGTLGDFYYWSDCEEDYTAGSWSQNGNTVTVTMDGETQTATILDLTSTTLKVSYVEDGYTYLQVFTRK